MRVRVFLVPAITLLFVNPGSSQAGMSAASHPAAFASAKPTTPDEPPVTFNEFLPEERGLGECISSVPRPGCGSDARGGWHQTLVFLAIFGGLGVIAWRIVAGARKARPGVASAARPAPSGASAADHDETDVPER